MKTLQKVAYETARKRNQDVSLSGTLKHLAGEVMELSEACYTDDRTEQAGEVADVVICCLTLCHVLGIDLKMSVLEKMERNIERIEI